MPKPVIAFFAALRKIFGKAEDQRETVNDPGSFEDSGAWHLHVVVEADPIDGGFIAECPEVPGAMSQGETEREAVENLIDAVKAVVEVKMEQHFKSVDFDLPNFAAEGRSKFSVPM